MKKAASLLMFMLIAAAFAACGDDDGASGETSSQASFAEEHPGSAEYGSPPLEFEADPDGDLAYTADEVTAKKGNVTLEFTNPQSVPHNLTVEARGGGKVETNTVSEGFAAKTITLSEDEYVFYCSVPGHREAGMEGTIKVEDR